MKPLPEILTLEEAASLLRVSTHTLSKQARAKKIPGSKVGREWRFVRAEILRRVNGDRAA